MSDLSRLLDGLYSDGDEAATPEVATDPTTDEATTDEARTDQPAPSWASEQALDDVFSTWVPGPSDEAGATERSLVADAVNEVAVEQAEPVTWDAPHPSIDEYDLGNEPVAEESVEVAGQTWRPSDDDILPGKRKLKVKVKNERKGKRAPKPEPEPKSKPERKFKLERKRDKKAAELQPTG